MKQEIQAGENKICHHVIAKIRQIVKYGLAICHHGTRTDSLFKAGQHAELLERLKSERTPRWSRRSWSGADGNGR